MSFLDFYPDELVSSWSWRTGLSCRRSLVVNHDIDSWASKSAGILPAKWLIAEDEEPDFGAVTRAARKLPTKTLDQLRSAARYPSKFVLRPGDRTLFCRYCQLQDIVSGRKAYVRRAWVVAWQTTCKAHGMLEDETDCEDSTDPWESLSHVPYH